jgi:hypothetical protein
MIDFHEPRCPRYSADETSVCDCLAPRSDSNEFSLRFRMLADRRMHAYYETSVIRPNPYIHITDVSAP